MQLLQPLAGLSLLQTPVVLTDHSIANLDPDSGNVTDATGNLLGNLNSQSLSSILPKPSSSSTTQTPKAPAVSAPNTPNWTDYLQAINPIDLMTGISPAIDAAKIAGEYVAKPALSAAASYIFTSRTIFLIIGLLLIGAGLFQFRATQTVIQTGTKAVKLGAKLAA